MAVTRTTPSPSLIDVRFLAPALCAMFWPAILSGQVKLTELPAATPLAASLERHVPMRVGQTIRAALVYPVYAGETEVLPARTLVDGRIVALRADGSHRVHSRLRGDLTPYRIPVVQFTAVELAGGGSAAISVGEVTNGAPIFRITPPPPRKGGIFQRGFDLVKQRAHEQVEIVTGPDKGDRLLQALYSNLPYHPQRVETATAWSFETAKPFRLAEGAVPSTAPEVVKASADAEKHEGPEPTQEAGAWLLEANLTEPLTSASTAMGTPIHAVVARPVLNADKTVAVPVGSVLSGTVIRSKPARSFGRGGTLRFSFTQLTLPEGEARSVTATLAGVDASSAEQVALDSEGQLKQTPKSVVVPLILAVLAARTLHTEDGGGEQIGKNATGANGFGLVGVVVGAAANSANLAAGIGFYGSALTVYDRYLSRGKEVTFAKDTRVLVMTAARGSTLLKPKE